MTQQRNDFDEKAYNPTFEWSFLAPKYWGTWIALLFACLFAFLPRAAKLSLSKFVAKQAIKLKSGATHRARVNLLLCFQKKPNQNAKLSYITYM